MNETQGRKEVAEAVVIAALSALATGLINWGVETAKAKAAKRAEEAAAVERRIARRVLESVKRTQEGGAA